MTYLTIEQAAQRANVPIDSVMGLVEVGLLEPVHRGERIYLTTPETYRLRFIVYLQREHHLRLLEIEDILKTYKPPYTDWQRVSPAAQ